MEPRPERPPEISDADRERIRRQLAVRLLWSGIAFLAVVALGLVPGMLEGTSPGAARIASVAAWILAPAIGIALIVVAALRLRR